MNVVPYGELDGIPIALVAWLDRLLSHIQRSGILHITPEFQSRRVTLAHKYDLLLEILCEPRPSLTGPALILSDTCCNYHPCSFLFTLTDEVETSVDMLLLP
ncbi:hypothetical protein Tco_0032515 [Tanacetum coccineum]